MTIQYLYDFSLSKVQLIYSLHLRGRLNMCFQSDYRNYMNPNNNHNQMLKVRDSYKNSHLTQWSIQFSSKSYYFDPRQSPNC